MPESCQEEARVIDVWADGPELFVKMEVELGLSSVSLGVVDRDGTVFESAWEPVVPGEKVETSFSSVLPGTEGRDIFYRLQAFDSSGHPLMDDFPFAVLFECHGGTGCRYEVLPGIETDALLVTRDLHDELATMPPCDTFRNLQTIAQREDDLTAAAQTLMHQLMQLDREEDQDDSIGTPGLESCNYAWQAVVEMPPHEIHRVRRRDEWAIGEFGGVRQGGAQHYAFQATAHRTEEEEWWHQSTAATQLEVSILCLRGGQRCLEGCSGHVNLDLQTCQCAAAQVYACQPGAEAAVAAQYQFFLDVNDLTFPIGAVASEAIADSPSVDEATSDLLAGRMADSPAPASAAVWSILDLHYSIRESTPAPDSSGAYIYGETAGSFKLTVEGISTCTVKDEVLTLMTKPLGWIRDGGVLLRRWHPPDELPARRPHFPATEENVLRVACEDTTLDPSTY